MPSIKIDAIAYIFSFSTNVSRLMGGLMVGDVIATRVRLKTAIHYAKVDMV